MLRDIFQSVRGFERFGLISMFVFVVFFILVVIYTYTLNKKDVDEFKQMPFDDSTKDQNIN